MRACLYVDKESTGAGVTAGIHLAKRGLDFPVETVTKHANVRDWTV